MAKYSLDIRLQPKQRQLAKLVVDQKHTKIGYGGARGGGKSYVARMLPIAFSFRYGIPVAVFRRHRNELLDNHIYPLLREYPWMKQYLHKQELILYHPTGHWPAVRFAYADNEDDIFSYQGGEYTLIFVDEATQFTQKMIEFIYTLNRDSKERFPAPPKTIMTMNPGGVGHSYIKRIFVDRVYQGNENPDAHAFIQSHVWDNVVWVQRALKRDGYTVKDYYRWPEERRKEYTLANSEYAKKLAELPEDLRLAFLEGDWNVFGGMFFRGLDLKREIVDPFLIPADWRLIGAIDPGFANPCSFGLWTQDFDGNVYKIFTYYASQRSPEEHAKAIWNYLTDSHSPVVRWTGGRMPERIVAGRDAWARRNRYAVMAHERTFADVFSEQGLHLEPAVTDRIAGWWAMKSLIPEKLFIFRGLNDAFVRELVAAEYDARNPEDISGRGNDPNVPDHALDESRYAIMALQEATPPAPKDPFEGRKEFEGILEHDTKDPRVFW